MNGTLIYAEDCFRGTLQSTLTEVFGPILYPGKPYLAVGFSLVHAKSNQDFGPYRDLQGGRGSQ